MDWLGVRIILRDYRRRSIGVSFKNGIQDNIYYFGESPTNNPYLFDRALEHLLRDFITAEVKICLQETLEAHELKSFNGYMRIDLIEMIYYVDLPVYKGSFMALGGNLREGKIKRKL